MLPSALSPCFMIDNDRQIAIRFLTQFAELGVKNTDSEHRPERPCSEPIA